MFRFALSREWPAPPDWTEHLLREAKHHGVSLVNQTDLLGNTPLMNLCDFEKVSNEKGNKARISALEGAVNSVLTRGARIDLRNKQRQTAVDIAIAKKNYSLAAYLSYRDECLLHLSKHVPLCLANVIWEHTLEFEWNWLGDPGVLNG